MSVPEGVLVVQGDDPSRSKLIRHAIDKNPDAQIMVVKESPQSAIMSAVDQLIQDSWMIEPRPSFPMRYPRRRKMVNTRRAIRCGNPGCENMTTHNGGYCSAACCKEHRR